MQEIEPFYSWREYYASEEDELSPFYGREYNEFEFTNTIYNYFIHPQWDEFGSATLYVKIIFADYEAGVVIMEFIGEWNDCLYNDIMFLKRDVIDELTHGWIAAINFREHVEDEMIRAHVDRYMLIGEPFNNLNWRKYKPQALALLVETVMQKRLGVG